MVMTALDHLLPAGGTRKLTPDEQAEIEDVLDAAASWQAGRLDTHGAASVGALEFNGRTSPGYSRFCAVRLTPASDPRRAALLRLVDHLSRLMGTVHTTQGSFTGVELGESETAVRAHRRREQP